MIGLVPAFADAIAPMEGEPAPVAARAIFRMGNRQGRADGLTGPVAIWYSPCVQRERERFFFTHTLPPPGYSCGEAQQVPGGGRGQAEIDGFFFFLSSSPRRYLP